MLKEFDEEKQDDIAQNNTKKRLFGVHEQSKRKTIVGDATDKTIGKVNDIWRVGADTLHANTLDLVERRYKRAQGEPITWQDYLALGLMVGNVLSGAMTSTVWTSNTIKFFLGGLLAVGTKLNDSINTRAKQHELDKLQADWTKFIEEMPYLVYQVMAKEHPASDAIYISTQDLIDAQMDPDNSLAITRNECSSLTYWMKDGTSIYVPNLYKIENPFTKLNYTAAFVSWLVLFANLAFDLMRIIVPPTTISFGAANDPSNGFVTDIVMDLSDPTRVPLYGNFSVKCNGTTVGNYSTEMSLPDSIHTDANIGLADWILTIMAGIPYMTFACMFTSYWIQNQKKIREQAIRHSNVLNIHYAEKVKIPIDQNSSNEYLIEYLPVSKHLLALLKPTNEKELYEKTVELRANIKQHNNRYKDILRFTEGQNGQEMGSTPRAKANMVEEFTSIQDDGSDVRRNRSFSPNANV